MGRWQPNATERLQEAAMTLFHEHGYAAVTITQITERAGLSKRTFFNHFVDKRDVLFAGSPELEAEVLLHLADASHDVEPMDAAIAALTLAGRELGRYGEFARLRRRIIASSPELEERSLIKLASLARVIATSLTASGVPERMARLVGQGAVTVFGVAYDEWTEQSRSDFGTIMSQVLAEQRHALGSVSSRPDSPL